jgi:hypothetical protein
MMNLQFSSTLFLPSDILSFQNGGYTSLLENGTSEFLLSIRIIKSRTFKSLGKAEK